MKTTPRFLRYLFVLIIASATFGLSVAAQETMSRVRSALSGVQSQVTGDEERADKWEELVSLKPLVEELESGEDIDPSVLRKTIDGLEVAEKPIDEGRLNKLRDALADWIQ